MNKMKIDFYDIYVSCPYKFCKLLVKKFSNMIEYKDVTYDNNEGIIFHFRATYSIIDKLFDDIIKEPYVERANSYKMLHCHKYSKH
jgi:hypothetical protein